MHPKPIETRYKGYRFRSRLEARWAVFFDALGLRWEYEPQGYRLPAGPYLPDFLVTWPGRWPGEQSRCWCEVKPNAFDQRERLLCEQLVAATGIDCFLLVGPPEPQMYEAVDSGEGDGRVHHVDALLWSSRGRPWWTPSDEDERLYAREDEQYMTAVHSARGARFEHGQAPYVP